MKVKPKKVSLIPTIEIEKVQMGQWHYHVWMLRLNQKGKRSKIYPLGQDVKFIMRIMNDEPDNFIKRFARKYKLSKSFDLTTKMNLKRLAKFILNELKIKPSELSKMEPWALSCQ